AAAPPLKPLISLKLISGSAVACGLLHIIIETGRADVMEVNMIAKSEGHACDNCQVEYFCARLKSILAIIESSLNESTNAEIIKELNQLTRELAVAGFHYPDGHVPCDFAENPERIQAITNQLIDLSKKI